jgi:hypothetical protein
MIFSIIFNTLYSFLKTSAIIIFLNDSFKRNFPEKYNEIFLLVLDNNTNYENYLIFLFFGLLHPYYYYLLFHI